MAPSLASRAALQADPNFQNNFPRKARWSADGSSLLVQCENRSFQMFETRDNDDNGLTHPRSPSASPQLAYTSTLPQPASIVDFIWYPAATLHHPPGYCFVASVRDCPVKLLDGRDGRLRASYPIVDHRERFVAPHSLSFNLSADKLYCGFEDAIEIFDVQRPGEGDRLPTTPSKKSKDGLKGIISTLAFSYSPGYYAAGSLTPASSWSDNISLFTESAPEPVSSIGGVAGQEKGGVTQLIFNPTRPHILYASFRRSEKIWSWDLRGDASVPLSCLLSDGEVVAYHPENRSTSMNMTNQRMQFDIDGTGRWLASGNQSGAIAVYDLGVEDGEPQKDSAVAQTEIIESTTRQIRPAFVYDAHGDAVGAVAFHPLKPFLLSVSGSRHFDDGATDSDSEDSDSDSESAEESVSTAPVLMKRVKEQPSVRDASIKLWDFAGPEGT